MYHTYNKATFESSTTVNKGDVLSYINQLINRSSFTEAIDYITKIKLPAIAYADEFNLSIMEQFIKLLIFQGYHLKAETIIEKAKTRSLDLYLSNESPNVLDIYIKLCIWESNIKNTLKRPYPSVPIYEALDNYFDQITNDLTKAQVLLQASHLHEFIGSQESFLKEAMRLVTDAPKSLNQVFFEIQVLNALGVFYGLIGETARCKDILEECISKAKEIGDRRRVAGSMINLANLYYLDNNQTPETHLIGRNLLQESVKLSEEIECIEYTTIGNLLLAEYYFKRGKSSQSLPYYEKVYDLQLKRGIMAQQEKIDALIAKAHPEALTEPTQPDDSDKITR